MIRINEALVQFTRAEGRIRDQFNDRLDNGCTVQCAAFTVLNRLTLPQVIEQNIGSAFVRYLSEGTVEKDARTWAMLKVGASEPCLCQVKACCVPRDGGMGYVNGRVS